MYIEQIYTNCLAEASYYIESEGEALVIDPIREPEPYLAKARERGAEIKYVLETHFHADFVSGHIDLAAETGAKIVYGPTAKPGYEAYIAEDKEVLKLGKLEIEVLHTPGHTPESTCFLLKDENGKDHSVYTGDTLFVGDVGRPDLLDGKISKEDLASMLYDSLNSKIKPLADEVIVYPGHGPGSACGKNIGTETWSTVGAQKASNYAMQDMSREEFIKQITDGLKPAPAYFFKDAVINKQGYDSLKDVMERNSNPLSVSDVKAAVEGGAMILDTRDSNVYADGFIPNSMSIALDGGSFAIWVGTLVSIDAPLVLIAPSGREEETVTRLARVGFENVKGYLEGGFETWKNAGESIGTIKSVTPQTFAELRNAGEVNVLDVRKEGEYLASHVKGAQHQCLSSLSDNLDKVVKDAPVYVHCKGGYRSMIASSILSRAGFTNHINVYQGYDAISQQNLPIEEAVPA